MGRILLALAAFLAAAVTLESRRPTSASSTPASSTRTARRSSTSRIKDFIVREDGQAREVLRVARDNDPLQIALLVDNSVVDAPRSCPQLRKAVAAFIEATRDDVPTRADHARRASDDCSSATRPIARRCAKRSTSMFAFEAGNYLLDGIAETSQGLAKRTMWRSAIVVLTGLGPEMSYRQYTEVLRFFREGGASLHVLQLGTRHRRAGPRNRREQGNVGNRRALRGDPDHRPASS